MRLCADEEGVDEAALSVDEAADATDEQSDR